MLEITQLQQTTELCVCFLNQFNITAITIPPKRIPISPEKKHESKEMSEKLRSQLWSYWVGRTRPTHKTTSEIVSSHINIDNDFTQDVTTPFPLLSQNKNKLKKIKNRKKVKKNVEKVLRKSVKKPSVGEILSLQTENFTIHCLTNSLGNDPKDSKAPNLIIFGSFSFFFPSRTQKNKPKNKRYLKKMRSGYIKRPEKCKIHESDVMGFT